MQAHALIQSWLHEEQIAHIRGWDFSHIAGRHEEAPLPWSYRELILKYLRPGLRILDMDTGGGEFLLSLGHPYEHTAAIEAFPPNVQLCRQTLLPLGIDFKESAADGPLPFENNSFDIVLNRHGSFSAQEIRRVLKPGGLFITQQVGADNDRDLAELLFDTPLTLSFPDQYLSVIQAQFENAGFLTIDAREAFVPIRFFDVGALVWFARIIEWEFPGFSVERSLSRLLDLQTHIDQNGFIEGTAHRFLLIAQKQ